MTPGDPAFIVDASVGVKLLLPEALSDRAQIIFDLLRPPSSGRLLVPDLFYLECANALWKHVRRGTLSEAEVVSRMQQLRQLPLRVSPTPDLVEEALKLAVRHGITVYDACYVALSDREAITLVSDDQALNQKLAGTPHLITRLQDFDWPLGQPS
jgi:predicted nucleic acid-binding protein